VAFPPAPQEHLLWRSYRLPQRKCGTFHDILDFALRDAGDTNPLQHNLLVGWSNVRPFTSVVAATFPESYYLVSFCYLILNSHLHIRKALLQQVNNTLYAVRVVHRFCTIIGAIEFAVARISIVVGNGHSESYGVYAEPPTNLGEVVRSYVLAISGMGFLLPDPTRPPRIPTQLLSPVSSTIMSQGASLPPRAILDW
jgi:hypothetical protein